MSNSQNTLLTYDTALCSKITHDVGPIRCGNVLQRSGVPIDASLRGVHNKENERPRLRPQSEIVGASRFVRVILPQGPCCLPCVVPNLLVNGGPNLDLHPGMETLATAQLRTVISASVDRPMLTDDPRGESKRSSDPGVEVISGPRYPLLAHNRTRRTGTSRGPTLERVVDGEGVNMCEVQKNCPEMQQKQHVTQNSKRLIFRKRDDPPPPQEPSPP